MNSFVTLFDKNYLSKGLLMYESLKKNCSEQYALYILAIDDETYDYLAAENFLNASILSLNDMYEEYPVLEELFNTRSLKEFCWTLSAFSVQFVMRRFSVENVIYLDSDIYFYNDPQIIIDEMGDKSVLITEHNFSPRYDSSEINGKYCVQFVVFKNNAAGNEVLENWRRDCEQKCTSEIEEGYFGDQKYLDIWESKYEGEIYNCRNIGCGVAPWNLQKYEVCEEKRIVYIVDKITRVKKKLVFFHFQALRHIKGDCWNIGPCITGEDFKKVIYTDYIKRLIQKDSMLPDGMSTPITNAEIIDIMRFMPIPYIYDKTLDFKFGNSDEGKVQVSITGRGQSALVEYKKSLYQGEWIIFDSIQNTEFVKENLMEIIWEIQKKEIYGEKSYFEYIHEILEKNAARKRIMTEINMSLLDDNDLEYPFYRKMKVTRFYDDVESDKGCIVYRDQLQADSQNMRL